MATYSSPGSKLMSKREQEPLKGSSKLRRDPSKEGIRKRYTLGTLSDPPTDEELSNYKDVLPANLPPQYKRNIQSRVFVNRDLNLDRINFIGFDMDYTLAVYTVEFEHLAYNMVIQKLLANGYPESISTLKYDPTFPIRGLFLDKDLGNLLKIDNFGNILDCVHGKHIMARKEIEECYPPMMVLSDDIGRRFYLLNTLFTLPEACLYGDLVEHLENIEKMVMSEQVTGEDSPAAPRTESRSRGDVSFLNLFQDVRESMDLIHNDGSLKSKILADMSRYIKKTPELSTLLVRLRQRNIQTFLLTNSEYYYTNAVMSYLLNDVNPKFPYWRDYFDVAIVGANKPLFFAQGTTIREVNTEKATLKITTVKDRFEKGKVYHGGSLTMFQKLTGAKGSRVLYIGDHVFADIIKSKKVHGWRSLLVVPELAHELKVWADNQDKYDHLLNLEFIKAEIFRGLDSESSQEPDITVLRNHIKKTVNTLNRQYNQFFGSLFRGGSKASFFAMQVQRYADLYTSDYLNLLNYPLFYQFTANTTPLPHETSGSSLNEQSDQDPKEPADS